MIQSLIFWRVVKVFVRGLYGYGTLGLIEISDMIENNMEWIGCEKIAYNFVLEFLDFL